MDLLTPQFFLFIPVTAVGSYFFGQMFGCELGIGHSLLIALLGALTYAVPTAGPTLSYLTMIGLTAFFSGGEPAKCLLTASAARLSFIPAWMIYIRTIG
ncbi:MAG: hypothetical protein AAF290_16645 [Pseudomonadota bacterium]|mgnify:CR=1 FL=1